MRFLYLASKEEHEYHSRCRASILSLRKFHQDKVVVYAANSSIFSDIPNVETRPLPVELDGLENELIRNELRVRLFNVKCDLIQQNEEEEPTVWMDCDTIVFAPINLDYLERFVIMHLPEFKFSRTAVYKTLVDKYNFSESDALVYNTGVLHIPKQWSHVWPRIKELQTKLYLCDFAPTGHKISVNVHTSSFPRVAVHHSVEHLVSSPQPELQFRKSQISSESKVPCSIVITTAARKVVDFDFLEMCLACTAHQEYQDFEVVVVAPTELKSLPFAAAERISGQKIDQTKYKLISHDSLQFVTKDGVWWDLKNVGAENSTGAIVFYFDDDDWYGPKYISEAMAKFVQNPNRNLSCIVDGYVYDLVTRYYEPETITSRCVFAVRRSFLSQRSLQFVQAFKNKEPYSLEQVVSEYVSTCNLQEEIRGNSQFVKMRPAWPMSMARGGMFLDRDLLGLRFLVGSRAVDEFYSRIFAKYDKFKKGERL